MAIASSRTQIAKKSLVKNTLDEIRTSIILGQYPVGTRMLEIKLSEQYNVSRGTIRTVMQELAGEGLVEYLDNGGCIVTGLDEKTLQDASDFRLMLELKAAEIILNSDSIVYSPLIQTMDKLVTKENSPLYQQSPAHYYIDLDLEVHQNLMYIANNKPIYHAWLSLMPIIKELLSLRVSEEADYAAKIRDTFQPSHRLVVDYAVTKDPKLLEYITYHIRGTSAQVMKTLAALREKERLNPTK